MNNKSRKTSHITNIIQFDADGHVVIPASLTLGIAPGADDNSAKVPSTAWVRSIVTTAGGAYVPTGRTITINGVSYDLSANRSWSINTGVLTATAGAGISVSTVDANLNIVNTGLLTATAGAGISVSTVNQNLNIVNTGLLTATAGAGISVSTVNQNLNIVSTAILTATGGSGISVSVVDQNLNIVNTGLLTATAGSGISISVVDKNLNIVNTGLRTATAGAGISISVVDGNINIVNTITNNNQLTNGADYATTSYVTTQINNLVSGAPGLLDTLDELAAALGDDANFSTTVTTALSNRLRIDTASQGLNSTQQANGRTNLGLGSLAVLSSVANAQITDVAWSKVTGAPAFITGNQSITLSGDATGSGTTAITVTLANSGVTAGTYGSSTSVPVLTVDSKGRVTGVTTASISGSLTFTGDVTGSGTTGSSTTLTLANSGVTAGTYTKVTVDAKGRVTVGASLASGDLPTYTGTLTSSQVTTALGYTPYNSSNPAGYISSYTETDTLASVTGRGASTSTAVTFSGTAVISTGAAWNAATPALNVGGSGDARIQVRHIWGKQAGNASTDHLWLQYANAGNHVQIGETGGGNNLYVSGDIYMNGYFAGSLVATRTWVGSQGYVTGGPYLPLSGGTMTGPIVNNTDGAVIIESNASENNNWLWKENAKAWGLFWFNRGSQSGQTIGSYTTVGAELMFMGGSSGIAMPTGWTGYTAGSNIAAMISNWNGYIYSASTVFAASDMRAPIFYDSNNTGYYGDFASTSRMNNLILGTSYPPSYEGQLVLGHTSYNFNFLNGSWAGSITAGILANCADEYEFAIHDSGNSVESLFIYQSSTGRILMGRDIGWGTTPIQAAADFRAPIFYDSQNTAFYLDPDTTGTSLRIAGGIAQNNIVGRPYAVWGSTGTTGAVVIKFPGGTGNYGMIHAVIDIYEYDGNAAATVIVGGHNWGGAWYNFNAEVIGQTNKPVRVGVKDGRYCIVIGNGSSSWSYGQVVLRKIQNGTYYSGVMDVAGGYSVAIESDSYSWISGDLRNLRTPLSFSAGSNVNAGNSVNISGASNTPINITGGAHKYLTINPGNGYEAMVRYIGGSGSSWYVGKRTAETSYFYGQITAGEFQFYSEETAQTVLSVSPQGSIKNIYRDGTSFWYFQNNFASISGGTGPISGTQSYYSQPFTQWALNNGQVFGSLPNQFFNIYGTSMELGNYSNGEFFYWNSYDNGNLYIGGTLFQNYYSDQKYKENIVEITDALEKLDTIRGVEFDWNELGYEETGNVGHEVGVIAQEVQAVYPHAVREVSKERFDHVVTGLVVDYEKIIPLLIQSVKELKGQVADLKTQLLELKNQANGSNI